MGKNQTPINDVAHQHVSPSVEISDEGVSAELINAKNELVFEHREKDKRAAELLIADKELAFQTKEKSKRAEELVVANKELAYQTKEKGKRAAELLIADKELAFQTEEKSKRAEELVVANKELAYQTKEKGKRAAELLIADKELAFQTKEKSKRASELVIANKELYQLNQLLQHNLKEITDYKYALDAATIIAVTDGKGIIKKANNNFCKISKYSEEELIGQDHRIINSGYHSKEFFRVLWITINKGKIWKGEIKNKAKDGTFYWVDTTIVPFLNERGKPYQYLAIRGDITDRKEAEEYLIQRTAQLGIANKELAFQNEEKEKRASELLIANKELAFQNEEKEKRAIELANANAELNKAKSEITALNIGLEQKVVERTVQLEAANRELESFSYSVSHDLRSPLRAINGFTKVLIEDYADKFDEEGHLTLDEIVSNSARMGLLIEHLLEFSKISKKSLSIANINMKEKITTVVSELLHIHKGPAPKVIFGEILNVKGDPNMIKQVFINLLSNAFKYSSKVEHPIIEIGSKKDGDFTTFYVKDNGAGFDMLYYDKLFGVFQRLHSNVEFEGTGVGLAIIHRIISKHSGKVWAEGKVNEGACFYVSLPSNN